MRALRARIEAIREEESRRIAREIHDELGETLTGLKIELGRLAKKLSVKKETFADRFVVMDETINTIMRSVRRIATELRPRMLDELGLVAAVRWQVREFQGHTGIGCEFETGLKDPVLPAEVCTAMFRILQEALTNVTRHARAAQVKVTLEEQKGLLKMEIRDDGVGIGSIKANDPASLGLLGMKERALLLGGDVQIQAVSGKGTSVAVTIPVRAAESTK